ncbi:hypothetical protein [Hymenobacter elongatus]|uniref:Uncharacterized protein n=1 Tax=Hymenobacter elongatus TaxID=877208 RepID=A0A4Z0PL79_9BACT|nr:hypothetical protein [Hymenobacter elongatus]TGE16954.1 hypothetical protein E5J99_08160 [Hymenobacter elongatus]
MKNLEATSKFQFTKTTITKFTKTSTGGNAAHSDNDADTTNSSVSTLFPTIGIFTGGSGL